MNCNSRHSFNLYNRRFSSLFYKWISFLAEVLQRQKQETAIIWDVKKKWNQFTALISKLRIDQMIDTPPQAEMIFRFEYAHSLFDGNKMGLGP